jgi:hypothetical protein
MRAYVITVFQNDMSETAAEVAIKSSADVGNEFSIRKFYGTRPDDAQEELKQEGLQWTYPWEGSRMDMDTGLTLSAYRTADPRKRIACFMSHYKIWKQCVDINEPVVVLEHDALCIKKFPLTHQFFTAPKTGVLGINSPQGATRRAGMFHENIQNSKNLPHNKDKQCLTIPRVDQYDVPQGLAGNSAYIIKPAYAEMILKKIKQIGAWPNDALLCYQNFSFLRVSSEYYTRVQGLPSTTTL